MNNQAAKLYVGFITYGDTTAKYLPYFLQSLKNQTFNDFKLLAFDNTGTHVNANTDFIKKNYSDIEIMTAPENIGFARANNQMIARAISAGANYFLALNPDMIFSKSMIEELVETIKNDDKVGAVQPKILKWDFKNNKQTGIIDSCGLTTTRDFCFFDKNQGEIDANLNPEKQLVGFTGAAALLRLAALQDVSYMDKNMIEYFDELMFMYKEDCDLSLRLRLAGWKIELAPDAIAYHDRTASSKGKSIKQIIANRSNKSKAVKKWSYFNHWIMILKYWRLFPIKMKISTSWYQLKEIIFALFFEQYLFIEIYRLVVMRKKIKLRIKNLKIKDTGVFASSL